MNFAPASPGGPRTAWHRPLLVVVEGANDVEFLMRLSSRLRLEDASLPPLEDWRNAGRVVFLPIGGGQLEPWATRFAPIGCAEFHVFDRERPPATAVREEVVARINERPRCRAALTSRPTLEHYLHPRAIVAAGGPKLEFGADDSPAEPLARRWFEAAHPGLAWSANNRRSRRRAMERAKRWLNTVAIEAMSLELLAESDPAGEVLGWLRQI